MARYANGATYHEGNDNLNEAQFAEGKSGRTGTASKVRRGASTLGRGSVTTSGSKRTQIKSPKTQLRKSTMAKSGVEGGRWQVMGEGGAT